MSVSAFHFSGGYITADNGQSLQFGANDFSISCWVKTLSGGTVIGKKSTAGGAGNGGFLLVIASDGVIKLATDNGFGYSQAVSDPCSASDGVWHHVAAVRQGPTIALYLDGAPLTSNPSGNASPPLNVDSSARLTIGTVDQEQEPHRAFAGSMAELQIWSKALTAEDISSGYNHKVLPGADQLAGYWPFEFGFPNDFSGHRANTTVQGNASGTTDKPAVVAYDTPPTLFLFAGMYAAGTKAANGWASADPLYITSSGFVIFRGEVLAGAAFNGNQLVWPQSGNNSAGNIVFRLSSNNTNYWPEGPEDRYCFEGSLTTASGAADFRGVIMPERQGCGLILNIGSNKALYMASAVEGAAVGVASMASNQQHFCLYGNQHILHMASGLALSVDGAIAAGSAIVLSKDVLEGPAANEAFVLGGDGLIRPASDAGLAVSCTGSSLALATAAPEDRNQVFMTLSNAQFVWSGLAGKVLSATGSGYDQVGMADKADDAPAELWYAGLNGIICALNGMALATADAPVAGQALILAPTDPGSAAQTFAFDQGHLVHTSSGLYVKAEASGGLVLSEAGSGSDMDFAMAPTNPFAGAEPAPSAAARGLKRSASVQETVSYRVWITTADTVAAGTDDRVEIALQGSSGTTGYVTLSQSLNHSDPFERGNTDAFLVQLPNVGKILSIYIRYGENVWFYRDRWVLEAITVYDPTTLRTYWRNGIGNGAQYEVPAQTVIPLPYYVTGGANSQVSVGKAPTQDNVTRGWVDHTWAVVTGDGKTTYFDAAGGHGGTGAVNDIVTAQCSLDNMVLMATSHRIDPAHPYQTVYGHDDVSGRETCGIVASGFRNWDGQCHQIVNRLLYAATPSTSLDGAPSDKQPAGYGLTIMMFGRYGVGWREWCKALGFPAPSSSANSLFDYIRSTIGGDHSATKIAYHAIDLQDATARDPQNPEGAAQHEFFRAVKAEGIPDATMAELTNLTVAQIHDEL